MTANDAAISPTHIELHSSPSYSRLLTHTCGRRRIKIQGVPPSACRLLFFLERLCLKSGRQRNRYMSSQPILLLRACTYCQVYLILIRYNCPITYLTCLYLKLVRNGGRRADIYFLDLDHRELISNCVVG